MGEFISACFAIVNLPFTILLIAVFLYWIFFILGAVDLELFDVDLDVEADADVELDTETDAQGGGAGMAVLRFFHLGEVPLMVLLSFFVFCMWAFSLLLNYQLQNQSDLGVALVWLAPNIAVSLIVTKVLTLPLRAIFRKLNAEIEHSTNLIGRTCTIASLTADERGGQAQVKTGGAPILVSVRAREGQEFAKGDQALIVSHDVVKSYYVIEPQPVGEPT